MPALKAPPMLYMAWQVLISSLSYFFSIRLTVALAATPFKNPTTPKQNKHVQNIGRFKEFTCKIMMKQRSIYPVNIHLPTCILLNTLDEKSMPVTAPRGERSNDNPSEPSVNPSRVFKAGMDVTQIPNKRLEVANKKPTEKIALFFIKEEKFLIMVTATMCYWIKEK